MEPRTFVKNLIQESLKGNFSTALRNIESTNVVLDTSNAVKVIVAICNACHQNLSTPENINEEDMAKLALLLLKFIKAVTDKLYEDYIQSVFYITKLLREKNKLNTIVHLRELFLPEFIPLILTEKHQQTYHSICKSMYNCIVINAQSKDENQCEKLLKLCYLKVDIYTKLKKEVELLESVHSCLLALIMLKKSSEDLRRLYQHTLNSISKTNDHAIYPIIINNLSLVYTQLLKEEKYTIATQCLTATSICLNKIFNGPEFTLLDGILKIVEYINPEDFSTTSKKTIHCIHSCLRKYHTTYNSTPKLQSICDFISSVGNAALQLFKTTNQWIEKVEIHSAFYKFLNDVALITSKTPYSCRCKKCSTKTNLNHALRTLHVIGSLGRMCILHKIDTTRLYKIEILHYLEKYIEYVTILKCNKCENWQKYWYDGGVHLYTIGIQLYKNKDTEMSILYLQKFVKSFINLESSKIIEKAFLDFALNAIAELHFENLDYEKCLLVSALAIILSDSPKHEFIKWIKAKNASRECSIEENHEIQELTLVSICDKFQEELKTYIPDLHLSTDRKIELLIYELRQYQSKWKTRLSMSAVFKELTQIAKTQLCAEIFVEIWGEGEMLIHDSLPKILQNLIKRLEMEKIDKNHLLGHLYFLQHRYHIKDTIVQQVDDMEKTMSLNQAFVATALFQDPDDECDLVSSYDCLKLNRYTVMMKELNKSLDLIHDWVMTKKTDDKDIDRLYKLLTNIAHEYSLHSHKTKSLQAWELALRIAETVNNPSYILQATSFILEISDVYKPRVQSLIAQAENQIINVPINNFEELIVYFLSKAQSYIFVDRRTAWGAFKKADQYYKDSKTTNHILQARLYLMHHKFIMLPCEYNIEGHKEFSLVRICQAVNCVNSYYIEAPMTTSYEMRMFFEIYESICHMYYYMRLPREVRCHAKDTVVIAQKMVLPLRTVAFLYYLAQADLMTCRLSDCRVKVKDFSSILELNKRGHIPVEKVPSIQNQSVDILVQEFSELMLDLPGRVSKPTLAGSPTFNAESFKLPPFFTHGAECDCFYCTSIEYQNYVLRKTYLEGVLSEREGNAFIAKDFFNGCITIHEYLKNKEESYKHKFAKRLSRDLIPAVQNSFTEIYCSTLLEYGNFLLRHERLKDADKVNAKILEKIEPIKLQHIYLYNEILFQRLNILSWEEMLEETKPKLDRLTVLEAAVNVKTPPFHEVKVVITPTPEVEELPKPKILPKSLKFDVSDEEDTEKKPTRTNDLPSFLNLNAKTPRSKIKVYKSSKESKMLLAEIPPFQGPSTSKDSTSEFYTPRKVEKIDNHLAMRTKLLTERLKKSSRKATSAVKATEATVGGARKKTNVRQNLMNQLDDAGDAKATRRSARNVK